MNITIKLHVESKSVHLSKENIERYINYKLDKIYSKKYLVKYKDEKITVYIDQREVNTVVKIVTTFDKKDIEVLSKGTNPYQVIRDTLQKLDRKIRKTKETLHTSSAYRPKDKLVKQKAQDEYIESVGATLEDEDFVKGDFDFEMEDNSDADEEDIFQKLINEF